MPELQGSEGALRDEGAAEWQALQDRAARLEGTLKGTREALRRLVRFWQEDPGLYDGDDDDVLGRLMYGAEVALEESKVLVGPWPA